jgi:hypothetical protein
LVTVCLNALVTLPRTSLQESECASLFAVV